MCTCITTSWRLKILLKFGYWCVCMMPNEIHSLIFFSSLSFSHVQTNGIYFLNLWASMIQICSIQYVICKISIFCSISSLHMVAVYHAEELRDCMHFLMRTKGMRESIAWHDMQGSTFSAFCLRLYTCRNLGGHESSFEAGFFILDIAEEN